MAAAWRTLRRMMRSDAMRSNEKRKAALAAKQRVEKGLEALREGLGPYVAKHNSRVWPAKAAIR